MKILPTPAVGLAQKGWKDAALWALRGGTGGSKRVSGGQILPPGLACTECCGHHCWLLALRPDLAAQSTTKTTTGDKGSCSNEVLFLDFRA